MNKFKTISILSQIEISADEIAFCEKEFQSIAGDKEKQDDFFSYCLRWKMAPWIYTQLSRNGLQDFLYPSVFEKFHSVHKIIEKENEERNETAIKFLKAFNENNIEVIILKGNLFAHTYYKDPGYKKMNDFDILVHQKDWGKIQEIYFNLGFIPMGFGWNGEKQKPAKFSHTGIPFISSDFKCIIGTQWGLKSPTTHFKVNINEAWETSMPYDFYGIPCKQLSPEYNLLHLILHMGIFKCGIRDCMDVYNLIASNKWDDEKLFRIITYTKAEEKSLFTLEMSRACSRIVPEKWVQKLPVRKHSFIGKRLRNRKRIINETGDLHLSYNDYFQDIEKNVIYFNIFHLFHQKIVFYGKILRLIYFPSSENTLKFIDKSHQPTFTNKLRGRVSGPWFSFSMIAQEIGWRITVLLFLKLFFDVLISPIYYLIPKQSYFDYLKQKEIDPKQIQKVVSNVQ